MDDLSLEGTGSLLSWWEGNLKSFIDGNARDHILSGVDKMNKQ